MRIRNLWLPLWLGLVGGSLFAAALWLAASGWPSSDRTARAGPPAVVPSIDGGRSARECAPAAPEAAAAQPDRAVATTLTERDAALAHRATRSVTTSDAAWEGPAASPESRSFGPGRPSPAGR